MREILRKGSGTLKLQITIEGKAYAVDVEILEDEESAPAADGLPLRTAAAQNDLHANSDGGAWDSDRKVCRSPVMGIAIKVNAKPGQAVEAGELLMVLEAMKMETNITAPRAATLKSVHVAPGNAVKVNQVLVEFE